MEASALGATFLAVSREAWDARAPLDALEAALAERIEAARAAWPGVALDGAVFAAHVAACAPAEVDPIAAIGELATSDLYLACACARGDARAIRHFEREVLPAAEPAIARVDSSAAFVDEAMHEVRVRLLVETEEGPARIRSYLGRGPLTHWVRVVAMRTATSLKRHASPEQSGADELFAALPHAGTSPELKVLRAELAGPFHAAFRAALATLEVRERNVLRLYLLEGVPSETIGTMYGVHRATVARWIASAHERVLGETRRRLGAELGARPKDLDTLVRAASETLEVGIATLLSA